MLDDLFQFTFQLLQLCCQLLGITACFASFFLSPGGHGLLPLGQLLQLAGQCGGLIELRFTGRLQQFLLFFQQILQLLIQLLLFVLQPLPFGCQLLLKILGGLPGGRRAVPVAHLVSMGSLTDAMDSVIDGVLVARQSTVAMHSRAQASTW